MTACSLGQLERRAAQKKGATGVRADGIGEAEKCIDDASFATVHALRDEERTVVDLCMLDFWNQESMGTQKFFEVAVPILDALEGDKCIFIDEYATYIHPTLSDAILSLYDGEKAGGAYMVLTTHDTALLKGLSRSEIVLVEKNHAEESLIYPLSSLGVRDGEAFEKRYLAGLYGAVPIIGAQRSIPEMVSHEIVGCG